MAKNLQETLADFYAEAAKNTDLYESTRGGEREGFPMPEEYTGEGYPIYNSPSAKRSYLQEHGFFVAGPELSDPRFSNMAGYPIVEQLVAVYGPRARNWKATPDGTGNLIFDTGTGRHVNYLYGEALTSGTGGHDLAAGTVGVNNDIGFTNRLGGMLTDSAVPFIASMAAGGAGGLIPTIGSAVSNLGGMTGNDALKYGGMLVGGASKLGGFGGAAAGGSAAAADALGLAQMGQAAGLSGEALDAFVASGGTAGSTAAGGIMSGYTPEPTNVAGNVVDSTYGVNPRTTNTGTADPFTSPDIPEIYQGPQPPQPLPNTPPINYGMTPTGTPAGGLTPTGGGLGLTQTAAGGAAITGGLAGAAGSTAVPGTVATGAGASIGGIAGAGTNIFDTFLDKLSNNPIQTAIQAAKVVSGIASGVSAMNAPISPTDAQRMADPFASSRQQYIDKLNALMANPSLVMSQPGYQFALQQGMQELNRNLSKSGMGTSTPGFPGTPASGAAGIAQQKYGQNFALKSYNDYVNQLSVLSGATQRPSAGSDAFMNAQKAASEAANSGWKSIDQAVGGLSTLFGRSPQTGSTTNAPSVGGGSAAGGTTSGGGGNFSPANWNSPNWYLNPSPSQDITIPSNFDNSDSGDYPFDYTDYSMTGP